MCRILLRRGTEDTSNDPYHQTTDIFIDKINKFEDYSVLELGSRGAEKHPRFKNYSEYIGFDIHPGKNVDVTGDIHKLSEYFPKETFDAVYSVSVFEHLAMPWKAVLEINKVMKKGGLVHISTHPTWPPHEMPWDFWRFSKEAFKALFNEATGFKLLEAKEGLPCAIVPYGNEPSMIGLQWETAYLGVSMIAEKIGDPDKSAKWDVKTEDILKSIYPEPKENG